MVLTFWLCLLLHSWTMSPKLGTFISKQHHWKYVENGSKCFHGGVGDLHRENKVVCQYPLSPADKERYHVRLLDLYTSKLPKDTNNNIYCTPLKNIPLDPSKPWFSATPVGWNKLDAMIATIFKDAGISGKTNHRLRVTGATRMYNSGIPEKTIPQSRTGHKSVEALRVYERPNTEQQAKACKGTRLHSNYTSFSCHY